MNSLPPEIESALSTANPGSAVLGAAIRYFACHAGTVHVLRDGTLRLTAHEGIPAPVVQIVDTVPIGKGLAGLAAERLAPVSLCNLQTDVSGQARPAARTTGLEGSIAVPMLAAGELRGVLGIAKATAHDWTPEETALLLEIAARLGVAL